jgi:hypothetical protein
MKAYVSYADWKRDQSPKNRKLIAALEQLVGQAAPQLTTSVKWSQGCFVDDAGPRAYIHAEDDHVQLGFYNGSSLKDPRGLLEGKGKYVRFVKIRTTADIDGAAMSELIAQAAEQ